MSNGQIYGVDVVNEDLSPSLLRRDIRPMRVKVRNWFSDYGGILVVILGVVSLLNAIAPIEGMPKFFDLAFLVGMGAASYTKKQAKNYPLAEPIAPEDDSKTREDKGLYLLGNDYNANESLWLTSSDLRTHILVFGTTGSGKSRFLLGILYQAMLSGSGAMYTDGKGDTTIWWLVYSFARRTDRIDDLLLINYLTGGENHSISLNDGTKAEFDDTRISNTTNPLSQGTAEQLRSLLVGLMRESGGEGEMWKGRSSSMLKALLETLCVLRDTGEINLDVDTVRHYMVLDRILELTQREDLPELAIISLQKYLLELPGYTEDDADAGVLNPECYKQHNFLTMQLTEVMSDLSGTYGHIFRAELGEVDFKDLVFNNRILFVMLPALEKDPDALAGLGKMIVAGVRSALAPALGSKVEGSKQSVIDAKPTNALEPFVIILDEYGYYAVKGFSVAAAQARSLGVGIIFAGQDFPSFAKASKEEAEAILANTTSKICMKLEDTGETAKKIIERAAKTDIQKTGGYEKKKDSTLGGYKDQGQVRTETVDVINPRDLVKQKAGEAHFLRGDMVYRGRVYYADPYQLEQVELNKFLMINRPKKAVLDALKGSFDRIDALVSGEKTPDENLKFDAGLNELFSDFTLSEEHKDDPKESACFAFGSHLLRESIRDQVDAAKQAKELAPKEDPENEEITAPEANKSDAPSSESPESKSSEKPKAESNVVTDKAASDYAALEAVSDSNSQDTLSKRAKEAGEEFEALLAKTITKVAMRDRSEPMSPKDRSDIDPVSQIRKGSSYEDPMAEFDVISERTNAYPGPDVPRKPEIDEIMSNLASVRNDLKKKPEKA